MYQQKVIYDAGLNPGVHWIQFQKIGKCSSLKALQGIQNSVFVYSIIVKPTDESCISILKISGMFPEAFYNFIIKRPVMN